MALPILRKILRTASEAGTVQLCSRVQLDWPAAQLQSDDLKYI